MKSGEAAGRGLESKALLDRFLSGIKSGERRRRQSRADISSEAGGRESWLAVPRRTGPKGKIEAGLL